ncbi:YceI family protein [Actinomadura parmotrematis]|uniref:YceI family protein n=1 Tax=Actinomadura parmotrematis TaxID=2864039 RepID=A0ABS7FZD4_9ACTN|nr:YceI family protein [Actinomadura parmotrematis]MBW8485793.1 YceI family protein [Actinomadura parmotrematis]
MAHELGPRDGLLLLKTGRSGLGRRAGHDLTLEATRWRATVEPGGADGAGPAVSVVVETAGLTVREGAGGVLPLSGDDIGEITRNLRKVLRAGEHPEIVFRSLRADRDACEVEGELTVAGRTEPLTVRANAEHGRVRGGATVRQTRWGIKPYSALLGALRLADDVEVVFDLAYPAE